MITWHLRITGRVQGVGYRESLCREAQRLGIVGWVRNRADGSVEALVQGEQLALELITAWAQHGPPAARVVEVCTEVCGPEYPHRYEGFERRSTA